MYILGGVWKAGVFWSAGQLFRNILPERKNRHHHHRGYIFVTFITSFSKTTKLFSSNLMNKAPNGNEAGDQTFAIFFKRQRNNFFFITFVCLPGKHWKVQREFLSGYLDNLTGIETKRRYKKWLKSATSPKAVLLDRAESLVPC